MERSKLFHEMEHFITEMQGKICDTLSQADGQSFLSDRWKRDGGGGGLTRVIQNGNIFEKGGVNISSVWGELPDMIAKKMRVPFEQKFSACGLSIIVHPFSPKIPTIHMNVRYLEMLGGKAWFGGGIDLTPYVPQLEDVIFFHRYLKGVCDRHNTNYYNTYKKECDDYFTIKHRNEMRGVGGIFFDYLSLDLDRVFLFVQDVAKAFCPVYIHFVDKYRDTSFTDEEKHFQLLRRGRYVEFNLIYDRGTLFGLKTNGRIESILLSLPQEVRFEYKTERLSLEEKMAPFYQPRNYINE